MTDVIQEICSYLPIKDQSRLLRTCSLLYSHKNWLYSDLVLTGLEFLFHLSSAAQSHVISIHLSSPTDENFDILRSCTQLKRLFLLNCYSLPNLTLISQLTHLTHLTLESMPNISSLEPLSTLNLQHLSLISLNIRNKDILSLNTSALKSLRLHQCFKLTDKAIFSLKSKELQILEIHGSKITDASLHYISSAFQKLHHFSLHDNSRVTRIGIQSLQKLSLCHLDLRHLYSLSNSDFIPLFQSQPFLQHLTLWQSADTCLYELPPHLVELSLNSCFLERGHLLPLLKKFKHLKKLSLIHLEWFTDSDVDVLLENGEKIMYLQLVGTCVTMKSVLEWQSHVYIELDALIEVGPQQPESVPSSSVESISSDSESSQDESSVDEDYRG